MKITLSAIKADIGSIGGHTQPSSAVLKTVRDFVFRERGGKIIDAYVGHCGDDIHILMTHTHGENSEQIHGLAWNAFQEGTKVAKAEGLYGAGQDLLKDAFTGNVHGMGPGYAEMTFEERESEPFIMFAADKTGPGAYNFMFYKMFCDESFTPGLILSPAIKKGFRFTVMDVNYIEGDKVVELAVPEERLDLATLLRDENRFVVESVNSKDNEPVLKNSTSRLHNIAGKYVGKDDPIALVRVQKNFPATEEVCAPFRIAPFVTGDARGSHVMALMPVTLNSPASSDMCNPIVCAAGFSMKDGKLTGPIDLFADPMWDPIRKKAQKKSIFMREQGWFGAAMATTEELSYTAMRDTLAELDKKFHVRK
ncbi:MAG: fructose 1,6-bisphosphatase [Candidatus Aenigmatarchaeota archaeon]